jgi:hypothetical protein
MEDDLRQLSAAVVRAIGILRQDGAPRDARAHHALAVLLAALWVLDLEAAAVEEHHASAADPRAAVPSARADDDMDTIDLVQPTPRSLFAYREERGMTIPQFTAFLGIPHHEYAAVVHRQPVDRRLRDQIAFRLGVSWPAIAEFVPPAPPEPRPQPIPMPAPPEAAPPDEPWYLVDNETGSILSGPHHEALPANAAYLGDPILGGLTNLVILWSDDECSDERQWLYDERAAEADDANADGHAARDELAPSSERVQMM